MDTVAVGDLKAWKIDPFAGKVEKGRLYGRGACDMKGGLVANLFALRVLLRAGRLPSGNVILQSTVSEEDGGAGALAAVLRGYTADAALIAEPTDLSIVPAQGGSLMFRMSVPGLSAHACVRDEGVSAIEKFAFLHRGLLDLESRRTREIDHPLYDDMTNKAPINFGTIHGGTWPSTVPDEVIVEGRAGIVPGEDLEAFKIRFAQEVSDLARQDPWLRDHPPRLNWLDGQFAAAGVPLGDPLVTTLSSAVEAITEAPARIAAVTYGADMRHFIHAGRMPCVLFGAGDVRLAHAPNEWIAIDDLLTAIAITATFIAEWCGTAHSASS